LMGWCSRVFCCTMVAMLSVYVYFYRECQEDAREQEKMIVREEYRPDITDVQDVSLNFCRYGESQTSHLGASFMFGASLPCPIVKMLDFISPPSNDFKERGDARNVTIHDARKNNPGSFHETGFTLVTLEEELEDIDWRSNHQFDEKADITKFHNVMEPKLRELYPTVKKIVWTTNLVRGGDRFFDQPKAVGGPHLDYHQNKTARVEFHKEFPVQDIFLGINEPKILLGKLDDEESKFKVMLGVWKPIYPDAVCDHPLAVMDVRTFHPDNQTPNNLHVDMLFLTFNNLNGAISYNPQQKWFYYPFQSTKEVLIFHQYTDDKWMANPHTSFTNNNCPEGAGSRISVELRVALFF